MYMLHVFFLCMYKNLTHQQIYLRARLKSTGHLDRSTGDLLKGARPVASFLHDVGATKKRGFQLVMGDSPMMDGLVENPCING